MRNSISLIAIMLFASFLSIAQAPSIQWQKVVGGSSSDNAQSILQTPDGGYAIAGGSSSSDGDVYYDYGRSFWISRLNSGGNLIWQKTLGSTGGGYAFSMKFARDGRYVMSGTVGIGGGDVTDYHGSVDCWVVALDDAGGIYWQKCIGGSNDDGAYAMDTTLDGGYVIAGYSTSADGDIASNHGKEDYLVVKLDGHGNIQWEKTLGGSQRDIAYSVAHTADGGYIVAGYTQSKDGDVTGNQDTGSSLKGDYWVVKLDGAGAVEWQKSFGGGRTDIAYAVLQTNDGGYMVGGSTNSADGDITGYHGQGDSWIIKLDNSGVMQWQKCLGGTKGEAAKAISATSDGGCIIACNAGSNDGDVIGSHINLTNMPIYDYWIIKLSSAGAIQWQKCLGGNGHDQVAAIRQTADGGYVVAGTTASNDGDVTGYHAHGDAWIVKLAPDGTAVKEVAAGSNIRIAPNPSNGHFTITIADNAGKASLDVVNTMGQEVLHTEFTGAHTDVNLPIIAGIYFVKLNARGIAYTSKLVIE